MKKTAVVFALLIFSMAIFLPFSFNIQAANAQTTGYTIQHVDQTVQILCSGHVVIMETIQLSGQSPVSFQLGFPYKYGTHLLEGIAYDANGKVLPTGLGVELQDQSGFYGVNVDLSGASSQTFTVVFTFSNDLLIPILSGFNFDFPAYPSFITAATEIATTVVLPSGATVVGIDKSDGIVNASTYTKTNLPAFTYSPATGTFSLQDNATQLVDVTSLKSQVLYTPTGQVTRVDSYGITNKETNQLVFFRFNIPAQASNIIVKDQLGRNLQVNVVSENSQANAANVTFLLPLGQNQSTLLSLTYNLPKLPAAQAGQFAVSSTFFPWTNYFIESATVTYVLPEGARFTEPLLSSISGSSSLNRGVFQETLTVSKSGVSFIDNAVPAESSAQFKYDYNFLWIAFRPTSWVWAITAVGVVVLAILTRPKNKVAAPRIAVAKSVAGLALSPDHIRDFVDAYDEKIKVTQEMRTIEARAQHGRIPRRRYKVQRRSLELRLETLSRNTGQIKEILRNAGGSYADAVRQLENAEVELNEVQLSLENIEVRHEAGEIPLEAYRKQLTDLERRKEKAQGTVNSVLLRLRGEIQ